MLLRLLDCLRLQIHRNHRLSHCKLQLSENRVCTFPLRLHIQRLLGMHLCHKYLLLVFRQELVYFRMHPGIHCKNRWYIDYYQNNLLENLHIGWIDRKHHLQYRMQHRHKLRLKADKLLLIDMCLSIHHRLQYFHRHIVLLDLQFHLHMLTMLL